MGEPSQDSSTPPKRQPRTGQANTSVRIDGALIGPLKREAGAAGVSVRRWVNTALTESIAARVAEREVAGA